MESGIEQNVGIKFPITHLRPEIQAYIRNISEMYQVPCDMVTLAVYVATAVSAGSRVTTFDGIYTNKLSLWSIVVGISGAGKTEYAKKIFQPILARNEKFVKEYEDAMREWNGKGKEPESRDFRLHSITLEALVEKINLVKIWTRIWKRSSPSGVGYIDSINESKERKWKQEHHKKKAIPQARTQGK